MLPRGASRFNFTREQCSSTCPCFQFQSCINGSLLCNKNKVSVLIKYYSKVFSTLSILVMFFSRI